MYYYRARYYSPGMGRFTQEDPLGFVDGPNSYAYVSNSPMDDNYPMGECPWCIGAIAGALTDLALQYFVDGRSINCINWASVGISAALGAVGGAWASGAFRINKRFHEGCKCHSEVSTTAQRRAHP
ncbi:RHS repeat-associated core domain-containing protein [Dokdonella fugitiva]|uniref:RHS repeat-associated core domain-containing protein n=1 Tax=Dokdonella fugitiva TaxID=328517 RepID=UPI003D1884FB